MATELPDFDSVSDEVVNSSASHISKEESVTLDAPVLKPTTESPLNQMSGRFHNNSKYDGDYIPPEGEDKPLLDTGFASIDEDEQYQVLKFPTPLHLGLCVIPYLKSGQITPHPWQIEISDLIASGSVNANQHHPFKLALCAANGSGKDAIIVALTVIWIALKYKRSLQIITSSSGTQLTAQTENYIANAARECNNFFGEQIFRIRQRYIKCLLSGSEIRLFATDEAGKAEGYHPLEPGAVFAIWANEAKSISEEIFEALRRCTGYTHWFNISTPGQPKGSFYRSCINWRHFKRVTSYDCPHLSEQDRQEDRLELGEDSALYRSKHLALFTSLDGEVVIPLHLIEKCKKDKIPNLGLSWSLRTGIDLAAGGDENSIRIVQGNRVVAKLDFRESDTTVTAPRISIFLEANNISKTSEYIFADDGGIGHAVIDMLRKMGWNIKRVNNQSAARNKKRFGNIGAENWYRIKRFFELGYLIPPGDDTKLIDQLSNRYFKQSGERDRIYLEKKQAAKAEGRMSPDRADAYVLAYSNLSVDDFTSEFDSVVKTVDDRLKGFVAAANIESVYMEQYHAFNTGQNNISDNNRNIPLRELVNN